ncbi:DUF5696 domain-containing protein [Paenibacillus sp. FSL W7-1332]|uniref:DUF5696 domain-containing protein n=1 Tax=Paenibacillus sp. FSL W7-1332 TaxID=2921702 RepID=UPI0030CD9D43
MKKILMFSLTVLLLGSAAIFVWGLQPEIADVPAYTEVNIEGATAQVFSKPQVELKGMEGVTSNGLLSLYYDASDTGIAVRNNLTGTVWYSNPPGRAEDSGATYAMYSPLSLTYDNLSRQQVRMTSFEDSVAHGQAKAEPINGGLKVTYLFGEPVSNLDRLPQKISKERYEKIMEQAGDSFRRHLTHAYVIRDNSEVYERYDDALKGTILRRTIEAFELAQYTEEDLARDHEEHQIALAADDSEKFKVSIEYVLDGADFLVRVPVNEVEYSVATPIRHISVLEYFGAGGPKDQGYLFVPDGSGSLIHMNKEPVPFPYEQRIYGEDPAVYDQNEQSVTETIRLPVFGIQKNHKALLAIIEHGASVASVKAMTNGQLNSYNHVFAEFEVLAREVIRIEAGETSREIPTYQERSTAADYVIRYVFLEDEAANYTGMALAYQEYLVERNMLIKREPEADLPFYLQLIGAIPKRNHFLGIPYESMQALTTFEQAQSVIKQLQERSLDNIKVQYTGWFNGGVNHTVPTQVSPEKVLGGKRGLRELNDFSQENGVALYPHVSMTALYPFHSLTYTPTKAAVRHLNRNVAGLYPYDPATGDYDREGDPQYMLAPQLLPGMMNRLLQSYSPYELKGISLGGLGDKLYSNFRRGQFIDRTQTETIFAEQTSEIRTRLPEAELMVSGGNAYLFPYARHIVQAPMSDSGFHITDESVPFYQIVLHGYVDYAGMPYNLAQEVELREYVLQCLEYGSNVYFTWIYQKNSLVKDTSYNHLNSVHYKTWIEEAAAAYLEVNEVLRDVSDSRIVSHEILAHDVRRTEYDGGKVVMVNYNPYDVTIEGITIKARDYYVGGEGA